MLWVGLLRFDLKSSVCRFDGCRLLFLVDCSVLGVRRWSLVVVRCCFCVLCVIRCLLCVGCWLLVGGRWLLVVV